MRIFLVLSFCFYVFTGNTQKIERFFDYNWKLSDLAHARFFSMMQNTDSGWVVNDFFLNEQKTVQMVGKYSDTGGKIKDGFFYFFYPSGKLKSYGKYVNNKKEGVWLSFYENGMMNDSSEYISGGKVGICKSWYLNGSIKDSVDITEKYATYVSWYDNGQLASAGRYNRANKFVGAWQFYHKNGAVASREKYDAEGNLLSKVYSDENGNAVDTINNKDREALFNGSISAWTKYLQRKLFFPSNYQIVNSDIAAVTVDFVVDEDGNIENVEIVTPFFKPFNDIALAVIKKSPKWQPAISHNRRVKYYHRQSITFTQSD
ncbi:MAG: energy transducer TonB [Sphingobacteriia bacterium]|nr:energy transducer TonB [Sphingobacteriia bacterium]